MLFRSTVVLFSSRFWNLSLIDTEAIPNGPCFLYGNHSNNYDPFMINAFTSWGHSTAGVMTMEYMKDHPLSRLFASVGIIGTHKHVPEPHLIRGIYRLLDQGRSVVIYPEGGRRWDGRPAPWIETTAKLFVKTGVPVHPIVTTGSYIGWPRWARYPRRANIELRVLPEIVFRSDAPFHESLAQLKAPISSDENVVPEHIKPRSARKPAAGIQRLLYRDPETGASGGIRVVGGDRIKSDSGSIDGRVLPDSSILSDATGEQLLAADIYAKIKALPYERIGGKSYLTNSCRIRGSVDKAEIRQNHARLALFETHLSVQANQTVHIPLENIRYVSTERSDKLSIHLSNGTMIARFDQGGSVLQWYNELHRTAPRIQI